MIAELDKDGSGQIEFPEFFYMMTTRASDNETRD
jgi:Ca2+-binding EF-hand superfamily protein